LQVTGIKSATSSNLSVLEVLPPDPAVPDASLIRDLSGKLPAVVSPPAWQGAKAKRILDILLAGTGLAVSAPLSALIALAIKLEDRGPIFYRQDRVGRGGKVFQVLKFRSMVSDAEEAVGPVQASQGDPRVTRIGRLLRSTALDELPQLWNILIGQMSFVGPRALRPGEIEVNGDGQSVPLEAIPGYAERHAVPPGLTGLAQVYAPRDIPRHQKFRYDLLYTRCRTFWLDVRLIAISLWISVRGRWEHREQKF
jgi:lipopolysaccharide/colanic/teichoic acid biosynthesis glycosyltransferase